MGAAPVVFSIVDIIAALTDSDNPRDYWDRMKQREKESSGTELSTTEINFYRWKYIQNKLRQCELAVGRR